MKLARITIRELSVKLGLSYEWTTELLKKDLEGGHRSRILRVLNDMIADREKDLKQAKTLISGEKTA